MITHRGLLERIKCQRDVKAAEGQDRNRHEFEEYRTEVPSFPVWPSLTLAQPFKKVFIRLAKIIMKFDCHINV